MAPPTQRQYWSKASQQRLAMLATEQVGVGPAPAAGSSPEGPLGTAGDDRLDVAAGSVGGEGLAGGVDGGWARGANGSMGGVNGSVGGVAGLAGVGGEPAGSAGEGKPAPPAKSIKVGWRVRRWLPAGTTEIRIDPGRRAAAALAVVLILGAAIAGFGVWRSRPVAEPVPAALPVASDASQAPATVELVVSVAGLVARPGLVRLPGGARVADAVAAAGGPVPGTDLTGLNLARRLADGEYVVVGPAPAAAGPAGPGGPPSGSGARVDLNTATLAELDALPGVGSVTAQRILDWRAKHGRFTTVDQLREIEGIGDTRLARLRDLVTV